MEEWKEYKLGEIGEIVGGATPSTKNPLFYDGDISWITPKDLAAFSGRYISRGERNITKEGFENSSCRMMPRGSVLFSSRAPIGYIAIADKELCTNQGFKSIIPNPKKVNSEFIYYLLKYHKNYIEGLGSGTTFMEVSASVMRNIEFSIPPLSEQKRIANILSSLDDKIECNRRINDNLEQQAIVLFDKMFPDIINGENKIGEWITPKRGTGLLTKDAVLGDVPVVAGGLNPAAYHNKANTTCPVVTISASGANAGYVALWNKQVWSSDSSYIDASMTPNVYFWYVMLKKRQKEIFDAQTGSAQPHIYPQHIAEMPVKEIDKKIVEHYIQLVTPLFKTIGERTEESAKLASIRDTLLPRLMSGELKIS